MTQEEWRESVNLRLEKIEEWMRLRDINDAREEMRDTQIDSRLGDIEDTLKWLVRVIGAALIMALLSQVLL